MTERLQGSLIAFANDNGDNPQAWIALGFADGLSIAEQNANRRPYPPIAAWTDRAGEFFRSRCANANEHCTWIYREAVEAGYKIGKMDLDLEREQRELGRIG